MEELGPRGGREATLEGTGSREEVVEKGGRSEDPVLERRGLKVEKLGPRDDKRGHVGGNRFGGRCGGERRQIRRSETGSLGRGLIKHSD